MVRYYKTTGIYGNSNYLRAEVRYRKDYNGYVVQVEPCSKSNGCYGITYGPEYYQHYSTLIQPLVRCSRRSKKQEEIACEMCNKMMDKILQHYVECAEAKGGRHIEIIGEDE